MASDYDAAGCRGAACDGPACADPLKFFLIVATRQLSYAPSSTAADAVAGSWAAWMPAACPSSLWPRLPSVPIGRNPVALVIVSIGGGGKLRNNLCCCSTWFSLSPSIGSAHGDLDGCCCHGACCAAQGGAHAGFSTSAYVAVQACELHAPPVASIGRSAPALLFSNRLAETCWPLKLNGVASAACSACSA